MKDKAYCLMALNRALTDIDDGFLAMADLTKELILRLGHKEDFSR